MRRLFLLGFAGSLFLVGCVDETAPAPGPVMTEAEAIAAAQHALNDENTTIMGPAARYDPETARVEEERPDGWLVSFGGFGEVEGQEVRFEVLVNKETGAVTVPGMPGVTLE